MTTFTREQASLGGHRSVEVRNKQAIQRARTGTLVHELATGIETGTIGQKVLETALRAAAKLDSGLNDFPTADSIDMYRLSQIIETLHKVYRLESGLSTSNALSATVNQDDLDARLATLREKLGAGTDTPAV